MFIAKKLRQQNIIEYLLYMWQIEDLLRAFRFDMDKINQTIVELYPALPEEKQLYDWYESLIEMMRTENVLEKGHIQLNKNIIIQLNDFHREFLKSGKDAAYNAKFYQILPSLAQLRQKQADAGISDIELCCIFLYGIMMLRMNKKEISPDTQSAQAEISSFLELLNKYYQQYVSGELNFED